MLDGCLKHLEDRLKIFVGQDAFDVVRLRSAADIVSMDLDLEGGQ
jgi:hypothetical protein